MTDTHRISATLLALTVFMLIACAPATPPPPVDPVKEQISVLQKQLLELQKNQNDTRSKVDEQSAAVQSLSAKVKALEEQRNAPPPPQPVISKPTSTRQIAPVKKPAKKTAKKKKKRPAVKSQP